MAHALRKPISQSATPENLTDFSFSLGDSVLAVKTASDRKQHGQFLTPPAIARYMAWQLGPLQTGNRVLDPSAGPGILSCAVVERAIAEHKPVELWIDCYETDGEMCQTAKRSLEHAAEIASQNGIEVHFKINQSDFILSNVATQQSLLPLLTVQEAARPVVYDHIIANPPYFKIRSDDVRARLFASKNVSHTNIYTLFIARAISCLANRESRACFIVPRSFCSGAYFTDFRRFFLQESHPLAVHLFESRDDVFGSDSVLQESLILTFSRREHLTQTSSSTEEWVNISTSSNVSDLNTSPVGRSVPTSKFWRQEKGELFLSYQLANWMNRSLKPLKVGQGPLVKMAWKFLLAQSSLSAL